MAPISLKKAQCVLAFMSLVWIATRYRHRFKVSTDETHLRAVDNMSEINPYDTNTSLGLGDATIISAYFEFPSKHHNSEYTSWMQNMLSLQDPMVIFTTRDKEDMIYRMREHAPNRTLVVVMQLEDAEVVHLYGMEFWASQRFKDPWRSIHKDPRLYIVWNEKLSFVKQSIGMNPFRSSHFLWMDIGFLRHNRFNGRRLVTDATPFAGDRVLVLDITRMSANMFFDRFTENENKIGAGIFGGTILAMERFYSEYHKTLATDIGQSRFVGVEQIEMWRTFQRVPNLFNTVFVGPICGEMWRTCYHIHHHFHSILGWSLITDDPANTDPWFYLVPYLLNRSWIKPGDGSEEQKQ